MNARLGLMCVLATVLGGCSMAATRPIATIAVPGTHAGTPLVIVLPGAGTDARALRAHHIDDSIHRAWPQADVLLTDATLGYYKNRAIVQRLQDDVIEPVLSEGYGQIWLAGASIGGLGAMLYERAHPDAVTGLVLLSPWLGTDKFMDEIRKAGGLRNWDPGPQPVELTGDNYEREIWRVAKGWLEDPAKAERIWLVCGKQDRFIEVSRLLAQALPPSHYLEVEGAHNWETWLASTELVIAQIRTQRVADPNPDSDSDPDRDSDRDSDPPPQAALVALP